MYWSNQPLSLPSFQLDPSVETIFLLQAQVAFDVVQLLADRLVSVAHCLKSCHWTLVWLLLICAPRSSKARKVYSDRYLRPSCIDDEYDRGSRNVLDLD